MRSIPVTILGGSDRTPGRLPRSGAGMHSLAAYKGATLRVGGRPLVVTLLERLSAVAGFGPFAIAGPEHVYGPLGIGAEIVDTDASVGQNLRAAIEHHVSQGDGPLAILACDVLPSVADLIELRAAYEREPSCALWFPFVRVPEDRSALGAFAWKPVYRILPQPGEEAVRILPGHLGIFEPQSLRLPLLYRLLGLAYRTRNRSVARRRSAMLRAVLLALVLQDLRLLATLQAPVLTLTVVTSGLRVARRLREGGIELGELQELIGRIFLRRDYRRRHPERGIRYPMLDVLSLAEDVDTEEEAEQLASEGG